MEDDSEVESRPANVAPLGSEVAPRSEKETTERKEIHLSKPDILDGIIHYQFKPKAIRDAFAKHLKLTPNWEAKYNRQFLEWAVEIEMTPEQVESAAELWKKDKRFNWQVPSLKGIQEHWLELVDTPKTDETPGEYRPAIGV
jgi:hypothetical protein